ncbi:type II secretion system protein GspM [Aliidiomarina indica]|uniref:type II secretion system protein GspM n=1 Tax=Aliidiomarina indica TaxID=2749147 RepID=UPI001890A3DB|nr:type II secretion system protein GspM [Aliidiomarina indica]
MNSAIEKGNTWFMARSERERVVLSVLLIAFVGWISFLLVVDGALQEQATLDRQMRQITTDTNRVNQEINRLRQHVAGDPNNELEARKRQLSSRNERLDRQLDELADFVEPEQLLVWMQALLTGQSGLKLRAFDTHPPAPFLTGAVGGSVYQHTVEVELEGTYFAIRDYLASVQRLPIGFYWDSLDYQVAQHPNAVVKLTLYTLSQAEVQSGL